MKIILRNLGHCFASRRRVFQMSSFTTRSISFTSIVMAVVWGFSGANLKIFANKICICTVKPLGITEKTDFYVFWVN